MNDEKVYVRAWADADTYRYEVLLVHADGREESKTCTLKEVMEVYGAHVRNDMDALGALAYDGAKIFQS